jgi:transcriptional regulator with XRE-family HTH domain
MKNRSTKPVSSVIKALRLTRRINDITLVELAGAAGISVAYLCQVERGDRQADTELQARLFAALEQIAGDGHKP